MVSNLCVCVFRFHVGDTQTSRLDARPQHLQHQTCGLTPPPFVHHWPINVNKVQNCYLSCRHVIILWHHPCAASSCWPAACRLSFSQRRLVAEGGASSRHTRRPARGRHPVLTCRSRRAASGPRARGWPAGGGRSFSRQARPRLGTGNRKCIMFTLTTFNLKVKV